MVMTPTIAADYNRERIVLILVITEMVMTFGAAFDYDDISIVCLNPCYNGNGHDRSKVWSEVDR